VFGEACPAGAAGFALSCPCIATDNSKGEHCYYISYSYSEEASDETCNLACAPCDLQSRGHDANDEAMIRDDIPRILN
jgi:hypothetical protein